MAKGAYLDCEWATRMNERAQLNTNPSFHLLNHALSPWFLARTGFFKEVREAGFLQCPVLPHHLPENGFHPPPAACPSRSQTRWEQSHFLRGAMGGLWAVVGRQGTELSPCRFWQWSLAFCRSPSCSLFLLVSCFLFFLLRQLNTGNGKCLLVDYSFCWCTKERFCTKLLQWTRSTCASLSRNCWTDHWFDLVQR